MNAPRIGPDGERGAELHRAVRSGARWRECAPPDALDSPDGGQRSEKRDVDPAAVMIGPVLRLALLLRLAGW